MTLQQKKLKNELFNSMKSMGLQNNLKTQIRAQLCQKLKQKDLLRDKESDKSHDDRLFSRILVSIIAEQLQLSGCQYAHSVYSAESGFDDKMLSRKQIVQIMGIDESQANEYFNANFSIVANLLKKKYPFSGGSYRHISVQANAEQSGFTLEQRLAKIDMNYRNSIFNEQNQKTPYEQVKQKVQIIEKQLKKNYEKDIERFKEFQAHAIKVNVSQQWRKKFEEYSKKLQADYSRKMQQLRNKFKNIEEDLVNRTKVFDEKVNSTTKTVAQKIQLLEMKSKTMDQTRKNLELEKKRNKEQVENDRKQLKKKISEYDSLLLNVSKKIDHEVSVAKLAIQQEYQEKQSEFLERKKFIDGEYGKLMGIKDTMDVIKQESQKLHEENSQLRKDLRNLQQELRVVMSENGSKSDRIDDLRGQVADLKSQCKTENEIKNEQIKKRKKIERDLSETRKQLQELREWKERNMENSHVSQNRSEIKQDVSGFDQKSELQLKMEALRQERRKQIQKLKLQL